MRRVLTILSLGLLLCACAAAPRTVYVVRHAEAFSNLDPRPDLPPEQLDALTLDGRRQAAVAAGELASEPVDWILHSPKGRTTQTAEILKKALPGATLLPAEGLAPLQGEWQERTDSWKNGADRRPSGGESMWDGVVRALAVIRAHEGVVVVVTHSDIAAALIGEAEGSPLHERYQLHKPATGSVTCIQLRMN